MKKLFLTAVVALSTLAASAQFMVVTTYDGDQDEAMDKLTANLGIGYQISDAIAIGAVRSISTTYTDSSTVDGVFTSADTTNDDGYDIFLRYNLNFVDGMYATLQAPTEDASDNMKIGVGISFNVWNSLYIEPNYTMPVSKDDNDEREGSFNIGLSYRF
jgi:opacity protein-like surface antigen